MCFKICSFIKDFIKTCFYIVIDVVVFFTCSLYDFADTIQWPFFKDVYGLLKAILTNLFEKKRFLAGPHLSVEYDIQDFQRGNAYVEDLLQVINEECVGEVFVIEDRVVAFQNTRFICIEGELRLCPSLQMNYHIMRSGNCSLREEGERSRVNASIKGCELYLECDIHMKIANLTKKFHVTGNIPFIEAYVELYFNNETLEDGELTDFIILEMYGTNLKFFGAGPLNSVLNFISKKLIKMFKRRVQMVLQNKIRYRLTDLVAKFRFPVATISEAPGHSSPIDQHRARIEATELSSPIQKQQARPEATELSPPTEQQQARPEATELSPPTEQQQARSEEAELSPHTEQQQTKSEEAELSPHTEQQQTKSEAAELLPPTEQQQAKPETAELSPATEQHEARPEAAEHSSPKGQQRMVSDADNSSPSIEQQIQVTVAENPHSRDLDSLPEFPLVANLSKEDFSQSSEDTDTAETDCSLEAS